MVLEDENDGVAEPWHQVRDPSHAKRRARSSGHVVALRREADGDQQDGGNQEGSSPNLRRRSSGGPAYSAGAHVDIVPVLPGPETSGP